MNVLHLMRRFSKLSETFIYDSVCAQRARGLEPTVLCDERLNAESRPFEPVLTYSHSPGWWVRRVSEFTLRSVAHETDRLPLVRARQSQLARHIRRLEPAVVHAHFGWMGVLARPVVRRFGVPLIVSFYGNDASNYLRQPRWLRAYHRVWRDAAAVVVLSEQMRDRLTRAHCPPEKLHVIHLGRVVSAIAFRAPGPSVRTLVTVGRLVEKKGHADLIDALGLCESKLTLHIIGDGPLREALEQRAKDRGVDVRFLGALENTEVLRRMREADAFALTSRVACNGDEEGTPTVLIEAQALGLPCVATRHAGIPEMLPAENHGLLASERDPAAIAHALDRLAAMPVSTRQEYAARGRAKVEAEFDSQRLAERLKTLYEQVSRS
ncbi:MAG: glycosyltransferase [Myxococcota bacterium]